MISSLYGPQDGSPPPPPPPPIFGTPHIRTYLGSYSPAARAVNTGLLRCALSLLVLKQADNKRHQLSYNENTFILTQNPKPQTNNQKKTPKRQNQKTQKPHNPKTPKPQIPNPRAARGVLVPLPGHRSCAPGGSVVQGLAQGSS